MAFTVGAIPAKDGTPATIGGGMLAGDVAGGGVGPWFFYHGLVDGIAGSNKAQVDASNRLLVLASLASADATNLDNVDTAITKVSIVDKAAWTVSSSSFVPIGGIYQTTATTSPLVSGEQGLAQLTINRAIHVNLRNATGAELGNAASLNVALLATSVQAGADANSNATVGQWTNSRLNGYNGSTWDRLRSDTTNGLDVDVTRLSALVAGTAMIGHVGGTEYETVAASQTDQTIGPTGATGDYLAGVLVTPGTTSPGVVTIKDLSTTIVAFLGGSSSVSNLVPFYIVVGAKSLNGAWKITTGADVTAAAFGDFT